MIKGKILITMFCSAAVLVILTTTSCEFSKESSPVEQRKTVYYFQDDFESYTDGDSLSANNPFDNAGRTVASSEQSYSGKQSAKMEIYPRDNGGFGMWGGSLTMNPTIKKGGEIWVRLRVYWPSSFQFTSTPRMKFMRLHNKAGFDNSNGGYNDLYIEKANETTNVLGCIKERHDSWKFYDGPKIPRDSWETYETYEMYLFVDDKSVDQGGQARMRVWRDGKLIFDRTDVPTITESTGFIDIFHLFTYWNNETPPHNYCYVDDLLIATHKSPPTNRDSRGNLFIGK